MKNFIIPEELLNKLGSYLGSKPFVEVALLIQELSNLSNVEELIKKESKDKTS